MTQVLFGLAVFVIVATGAATVAALLARANWFLDLFSNFPVQYAVLLALSAVVCLALHQWGWAALAVLALVPNVIAIASYLPGLVRSPPPVAQPTGPARPILLVSLNLQYSREDATATRAWLEQRSADILVLSELTPRWHEKLPDLERLYPHAVIRPRWDPWGLAVYSRYPLVAVEDLDLGDDQSAHLRVVVRLPTGLLEVYGVHLASPPTPRDAARRDRQFARLVDRIRAADPALPKVVVGDLNATPWTPSFRDFLRNTGLVDARRPFGLQVTWPFRPSLWSVPFRIPIDHCLASPGLDVTAVDTGPAVGSDHLPLECWIALPS
ncbi:MAG: endonuclease/exonuclease/phosphatase family protein [Gammaproteobacteria bacterium PRO9]|nr:endonuclease/exonuclease/phosphatase family protein [Gammaproteobacteria bacterium PRO9]